MSIIQQAVGSRVGNGTLVVGSQIRGKILALKATADSAVTDNWDIAVTGETSGIPVLTDTAITNDGTEWFHPRALASKVADGSAATDAFVEIPLYKEGLQCVITNAGTTGTITITLIYEAAK